MEDKTRGNDTRITKVGDMALLFDFYGELLTQKQQEAIKLFYEDDMSLGEIAAAFATTRQAVHDLLRRGESLLREYEKKLGLVGRYQRQQAVLKKLDALVETLHQEPKEMDWQQFDKLLQQLREVE